MSSVVRLQGGMIIISPAPTREEDKRSLHMYTHFYNAKRANLRWFPRPTRQSGDYFAWLVTVDLAHAIAATFASNSEMPELYDLANAAAQHEKTKNGQQQQLRSMTERTVQSLPLEIDDEEEDQDSCFCASVCSSGRVTLACSHSFHYSCILKTVRTASDPRGPCPICRACICPIK